MTLSATLQGAMLSCIEMVGLQDEVKSCNGYE